MINSGVVWAKGSIEVVAKDCRSNEERPLFEIELFHNNYSLGIWHPDFNQLWDGFTINRSFSQGVYYIEYKSIFGKIERKKTNILNGFKQKVYLCVDKINHKNAKYNSIIDKLENGDKYVIQNSYRGSFDYGTELITIEKNSGLYYAEFKKKRKMLSKKEIELFINFEIELNIIRNRRRFCSWSNTFLLSYKQGEIEIIDSNCDWNGWTYLLKQLGWKAFKLNKT
jgi:hypothetical protein